MKITAKLFKEPERIEESTVSIETEIFTPEKTNKELFDEAVEEVVISKLSIHLESQLSKYSQEEAHAQTKEAIKEYGEEVSERQMVEIIKKYPRAKYITGWKNDLVLTEPGFSLQGFVDRIIRENLK